MPAEIVQSAETSQAQSEETSQKKVVQKEPTSAEKVLDANLVKDAEDVSAEKSDKVQQSATPVVTSPTKEKPTTIAAGGMIMKLINGNPQAKKILGQARQAWEKQVAPKIEPAMKIWMSIREDYPDLLNYVLATVLIVYGGCFTNLTVLFAALSLAGTVDVANSVFQFGSKFQADKGVLNGVFALLRSTSPEEVNKMVAAVCVQICVLKLMVGWLPSFALTLGFAIGNHLFEAAKPELIALIKRQGVFPEDLIKWVPFATKYTIGLLCAIVAAIAPTFTATVLAGFYGVGQVKGQYKFLEGTVGCAIPVIFAVWQAYGEYEVSTLAYLILSPLFLMNSLL